MATTYQFPDGFAAWANRQPPDAFCDCITCAGDGLIECERCNGEGEWEEKDGTVTVCRQCRGAGVAPCVSCGGRGDNALRLFREQRQTDMILLAKWQTTQERR